MSRCVLLSWLAYNNDPFERDRRTGQFRPDASGNLVPGPTLTLLFDNASLYKGRIDDVILLGRITPDNSSSQDRIEETKAEIERRDSAISVHARYWRGLSPIDHAGLFRFLRERIPEIRRQFPDRELVVNVSPGTPAMHAVWILLAETGLIEPPFRMVQTLEPQHREPDGAASVPIEIGLDTLYKATRSSKPAHPTSKEEPTFWDPSRFRSTSLRRTYEEARRYASLNVPILILGERGTGKTTLASWIRASGPYRKPELDGEWPSVPCGQYAPETMRAELFGYKKGAFTDAHHDYDGLLHRANGDTLFLDEIGDISRDLQRLLIRAIEDGSYTPLGSLERKTSNFRLLTATNVSLAELHQRVDPDFLDRISPLQLRVPPLRELRDDLDWIWEGVYREAALRSGAEPIGLTDSDHAKVVAMLQDHPLPGNIRDLYRVAYRLLAHADSDEPLEHHVASSLASSISSSPSAAQDSAVTATLRACADRSPMDEVYDTHGPIPAMETIASLKQHIAQEARALAKRRGLRIDEIADVTDRTLFNWTASRL